MALEKAEKHLKKYSLDSNIRLFDTSSATVALAAAALGCEEARIAKTLSFSTPDGVILIVCAGDAKVDNRKFKDKFSAKPKMLAFDEVEPLVGHAVGGVCPFGVNADVKVYLDDSLRRFDIVYPAAGTANSAVRLTIPELELSAEPICWVDVTKLPENE